MLSSRIKKYYYAGFPPETYSEYGEQIAEANYSTLCAVCSFGAVMFALLMIGSLIFAQICDAFFVYLIFFFIFLVAVFFRAEYIDTHISYSLYFLYALIAWVFVFTIVLGTAAQPKSSAAVTAGALAVLPQLILDRPGRIGLMSLFFTLVFCVAAVLLKPESIARLDCVNAVIFFMVGNYLASYSIRAKLSDMVAREQTKICEDRYRAILLDSNDIIFELNQTENFHFISSNYLVFFDRSFKSRMPNDLSCIFPEDMEIYRDIMDAARGREKGGTGQLRFITKSGRPMWFSLSAVTLRTGDGDKMRLIGRLVNIDDQKRESELLKVRSQIDHLTGIYNRFAAESLITQHFSCPKSSGGALLVVDLDDLKAINDSYGHAEGDRAIKIVARTLKSTFRTSDVVGRIGGDEFIVFIPEVSDKNLLGAKLDTLMRALSGLSVGTGDRHPVTCSVGAVLASSSDDLETLFKKADTALYKVKRGTKSQYTIYAPDMSEGDSHHGFTV